EGGYDLLVTADDAIERVPLAVWIRKEDPARPRTLHVAQLSDLHVGKPSARGILKNLDHVIDEVNRLHPDLVLLTGDVVDNPRKEESLGRAREALWRLRVPLYVVPGNHDPGFGPAAFRGHQPTASWQRFARWFHAYRFFTFAVADWRFVGFDTG